MIDQMILALLISANGNQEINPSLIRAVEFYANPATDSTKAVQGDTSKLWIPGYPDYTLGSFNENGKTYLPYSFWQHQPQMGDTFNIWAKAVKNGKIYETTVRAPFKNEEFVKALEGFLNNPNDSLPVHAANIGKIIVRSGITDSIITVSSYNLKNPSLVDSCELSIDKGDHFYHVFNTENIDPQPGNTIRSVFTLGPVSQYLEWQVDKTLGDAQLIADSLVFEITGAKEGKTNELENLIIRPNPATDHIVFGKKFNGFLYDVTGKKVASIDIDKGHKLDLKNIPVGIYYIMGKRTELDELKPHKLIKIK